MTADIAMPVAAPRNRAENRVYRRESLIRSAIATVGRYDLTGATVERICHGAGASRGLIAHYFDSKEELLLAAAGETFDAQAMAVKKAIANDRSLRPDDAIKRMARSSFEPPIFSPDAIAAWQAFTNASRSQPVFLDVIRQVSEHLQELYEPAFAAAATKRNVSLDAAHAALGLITVVDGLWNNLATGRDGLGPKDAIQVAERYIDGCLLGTGRP
ncbi:MAG: TetR family transcriptional regulator C-terminal domain-containing protein [Pseudomonadota bacterium]